MSENVLTFNRRTFITFSLYARHTAAATLWCCTVYADMFYRNCTSKGTDTRDLYIREYDVLNKMKRLNDT